MANLRHIGVTGPDPAKFVRSCEDPHDPGIAEQTDFGLAFGVYPSDGLFSYRTGGAAGMDRGLDNVHSRYRDFGCDRLGRRAHVVEARGGAFFRDPPLARAWLHTVRTYHGANHVMAEISENGWAGTAHAA